MRRKTFIALILVALFCSSNLFALDRQNRNIVVHFVNCYKRNDLKALSQLVRYPLLRQYPLPSIKTPAEFLKRFTEVFDQKLGQAIVGSKLEEDWAEKGWQGIMLNGGWLWLDYEGKLIGVNYQSEVERKKRLALIEEDKKHLHSSLKEFSEPVLDWKTKNHRIRIDLMNGDQYRYAVWPFKKGPSEEPDLVLMNGVVNYEGTGGNRYYEFKNGVYTYRCYAIVMGAERSEPGELEVLKNGKVVLNEVVLEEVNR